jgi:hypothetical protein
MIFLGLGFGPTLGLLSDSVVLSGFTCGFLPVYTAALLVYTPQV